MALLVSNIPRLRAARAGADARGHPAARSHVHAVVTFRRNGALTPPLSHLPLMPRRPTVGPRGFVAVRDGHGRSRAHGGSRRTALAAVLVAVPVRVAGFWLGGGDRAAAGPRSALRDDRAVLRRRPGPDAAGPHRARPASCSCWWRWATCCGWSCCWPSCSTSGEPAWLDRPAVAATIIAGALAWTGCLVARAT